MDLTRCDLCSSSEADFILATERLDGPLLRCRSCGLYYVELPGGRPQDAAAEMARLAGRAGELALVEPEVESGERPWRLVAARERLSDLRRFIQSGRLLEIGSSTGEFLEISGSSFTPTGVEADPRNLAACRAKSLDCLGGTLREAQFPDGSFDAAALYHVIEHFKSPASEVRELHRVLRPGGLIVIETPNIASLWFSLLGARWRQIIPDHVFFFTPATIERLLGSYGFEILETRSVGKAMSLRLFISRLGRYNRTAARLLENLSSSLGLGDLTVRLRLGDVMRVYARKAEATGEASQENQ